MFSVVIPLYNKELSVRNTINSVLDQTFKEFEIVIVNDGSTDNSLEIVQQFKDDRIRIIDKPNGGVSSARNRGIKEAKYDWIAFLDADDLWMENHLSILKNMVIKYPKYKVFTTSFIRSTEKNNGVQDDSIFVIENYFKEVIKDHVTWTSVICVNKKVFDDVGVFNEQLNRGEDLDLWARIGREYRYVKSNLVTAIYRIEAENRSDVSFKLKMSRIYNYDFKKSSSKEETTYYKAQIIKQMRALIKQLKIVDFFKLKYKHNRYISFVDIIKS